MPRRDDVVCRSRSKWERQKGSNSSGEAGEPRHSAGMFVHDAAFCKHVEREHCHRIDSEIAKMSIGCSMSMLVSQSLSNFCPCPVYVLHMSIMQPNYVLVHVLSTICLKVQLMSSPNLTFVPVEMLKSNFCLTFVLCIAQTPSKNWLTICGQTSE